MKVISIFVTGLAACQIVGCASATRQSPVRDLAHYPFPEAQEEIRKLHEQMTNDCETGNAEGLRNVHLRSDKFTKFGGSAVYERMNYNQAVEGEIVAITSVQEYKSEVKDQKIDVFGDVAVMTYYPHRVVKKDGKVLRYSTRQTLVFLKTVDGWKIVHEHQSPKKYED